MPFTKTIYSIAVAVENRLIRRSTSVTGYIFTTDFVSRRIAVWEQHLAEFKGKENVSVLEIGSFEGRSTIWFLENILTRPTSSITCVDPFFRAEIRFDHNIKVSGHANQVKKIKGRSESVLRTYPHLRHIPSDILILPLYVVTVYALGMLKIYAFVTMNQQGWITRSKEERTVTNSERLADFFRAVPSYVLTLGLILLLVIAVISYKNTVFSSANSNTTTLGYMGDEGSMNIEEYKNMSNRFR